MSEQELLDACSKGDLETVQQLLASKEIDVNCEGILNVLIFIEFKSYSFHRIKYLSHLWN